MTAAAPRLDPRLVEHLVELARGQASPAEIRRALVVEARGLGIPPPSYEHVRRLVALERLDVEVASESELLSVLLGVAIGTEHGNELLRVAHGERRRRR